MTSVLSWYTVCLCTCARARARPDRRARAAREKNNRWKMGERGKQGGKADGAMVLGNERAREAREGTMMNGI